LTFDEKGLLWFDYPEHHYVDRNGQEYHFPATNYPLSSYKSTNGKFGFFRYTLSKESEKYGIALYEREQLPAKYDTLYQVITYGDWGESYDEVSNEGFRYVGIANKRGIVDSTGKELTPIKYDWMDHSFWGGEYAKVGLNGKIGLIDKTGREIVAPAYYEIGGFSEGLASVRLNQGGNFGYVDTNGKLVIDTILNYLNVGGFSEGYAIVEGRSFLTDEEGMSHPIFGYIDSTGKEVIAIQFSSAEKFKNGKAKVMLGDREYFIDTNGIESK
jgi:hypothetical protein